LSLTNVTITEMGDGILAYDDNNELSPKSLGTTDLQQDNARCMKVTE